MFITHCVLPKSHCAMGKSWRVLPVNRHEISFQGRRNIVPRAPEHCSKAAGTLFQGRRNVCPRPWDGRGILCLFKNSASYGNAQAQSPALDLWSLATDGTQERASSAAKVELSYMIGVAQPSSIYVELTDSNYKVDDVTDWTKSHVDLSPDGIILRFGGGYPRSCGCRSRLPPYSRLYTPDKGCILSHL